MRHAKGSKDNMNRIEARGHLYGLEMVQEGHGLAPERDGGVDGELRYPDLQFCPS